MPNFWKTLGVGIVIIVALITFLPEDIINLIGRFALGWMIVDIVSPFFKE